MKTPKKAARRWKSWKLQITVLCCIVFLFLLTGTISILTRVHAASVPASSLGQQNVASLDMPTGTGIIPTDTTTATPSPTATATPSPTATATPSPTPTTIPTPVPTPIPVGNGVGGDQQPTPPPTPSITPEATATTAPTATPAAAPHIQRPQNTTSSGSLVSPTSVISAMASMLLIASVLVVMLMRRKQTKSLGQPALLGASNAATVSAPATLAVEATAPACWATPPMQAPGGASSPVAQQANSSVSQIPTQAIPLAGPSPLPHDGGVTQGASTPQQDAAPQDVQSSDLRPLTMDLPFVEWGADSTKEAAQDSLLDPAPQEVISADTPQNRPSSNESVNGAPLSPSLDAQIVATMRQVQMGIFVLPNRAD